MASLKKLEKKIEKANIEQRIEQLIDHQQGMIAELKGIDAPAAIVATKIWMAQELGMSTAAYKYRNLGTTPFIMPPESLDSSAEREAFSQGVSIVHSIIKNAKE